MEDVGKFYVGFDSNVGLWFIFMWVFVMKWTESFSVVLCRTLR